MSQTKEAAFYLVAFVDVLGQAQQLRQLVRLPESNSPDDEMLVLLRNTLGVVMRLREAFSDIFASGDGPTDFALSLSPADRERLAGVTQTRFFHYGFSDSIIIAVPLKAETGDPTPVNSVWRALVGVCGISLVSLATGHALRGGIDVGVAVKISDSEVYGAALERAYTLESRCAESPRFLVGAELVDYLKEIANSEGVGRDFDICRMRARACLELFARDEDGKIILDFLGPAVRRAFSQVDTHELVTSAYRFVCEEAERYAASEGPRMGCAFGWRPGIFGKRERRLRPTRENHQVLADRYAKLRRYFEKRMNGWL